MSLIPDKDIQTFLAQFAGYADAVDGIVGQKTVEAMGRLLAARGVSVPPERWRTAVEQIYFSMMGLDVGPIDGFDGPRTQGAWRAYVQAERDSRDGTYNVQDNSLYLYKWPRESEVPAFFGDKGANQRMTQLPYPMKYVYGGQTVMRMSLHEKVADSAVEVFEEVLRVYGQQEITRLGLDLWGGSLNVRRKVGGTAWSMHSWGIAIDFDPEHNGLHTPYHKARFGASEYEPWWAAWEKRGWVSLGRSRNYDTMHVQAANL